jgi:hypothetical protein
VDSVALHARPPWSTLSLHHAMLFVRRVSSRLSSPLSYTKSCSRNSMTTAGSDTTSEGALNRTMGKISIATKEQPLVNNGVRWELT